MELGDPKSRKARVYTEKKRIAEKHYGMRCGVCEKRVFKGTAFHHLDYRDDRKTYRDFDGDTVSYLEYVLPEVDAEPDRFLYLCKGHHRFLEFLNKMKPENKYRLLRAVELTKT